MTRVYVDGQEGTTGLQIRQVLAARDDIDVLSIDPGKRKDPAERARLLRSIAEHEGFRRAYAEAGVAFLRVSFARAA
jgi:N-acetyl-gamma-glutamylphosphate reductase